ncbi:zinc finger, C4 type [Cooperia oncophora]
MGMLYYSMAALNGNLAEQLQNQLSYTSLQNGVDLKPFAPSPSYKRMAQRRKVPEGELCAVCSDLATGYHYGVASCNGCKTFFRRTIVSEQTFICQYNGNCDVNKSGHCFSVCTLHNYL